MPVISPISVGFTFVDDGRDWQGGLNYFRSLFLALAADPACVLRPIAFIGDGVDLARYAFPSNVRVVHDSAFTRGRFRWKLDRLAGKLLGQPMLTNRLLRRQGVTVRSHGEPSGERALKSIGWIPDFQHVHLPRFFPREELARREKDYKALIEASDRLIVSSEAARKDLERFSPSSAGKARVLRFVAVPPALEPGAFPELVSLYGLDGAYFYIPNQTWAHKNHMTAIRALAEVRRAHPDVKIVCSGSLNDYRNPDHLASLRAEIARLGLDEHFVLLGAIPYAHIAQLMLNAVAVINPSLFEGWSTTVEEAKALGVPLVLSSIDVHREQCQEGQAVFFDPLDATSLAGQLQLVLERPAPSDDRRLSKALEAHRLRTVEFAQAYQRIILELGDAA